MKAKEVMLHPPKRLELDHCHINAHVAADVVSYTLQTLLMFLPSDRQSLKKLYFNQRSLQIIKLFLYILTIINPFQLNLLIFCKKKAFSSPIKN